MPTNREIRALLKDRLASATMFDDGFMTAVLDNNPAGIETIIRTVLGMPDLKIAEEQTQRKLQNLEGRTSILDVVAEDDKGNLYDIEIQNADAGARPRRARYHASLLDSKSLEPSEPYEALHDSYIIFITRNDVMGSGLPVYFFDRIEKSTGASLDDGSHIVYVNGQYEDAATDLGRLISDLKTTNPDTMHFEALSRKAKLLKEGERGAIIMGQFWEDIYNEAEAEGRAAGMEAGLAEGRAQGLAQGLAEGRAQGLAEGVAEGKAEGLAEGLAEGKAEGMAEAVKSIMAKLDIPLADAIEVAGVSDELRDAVKDALEN